MMPDPIARGPRKRFRHRAAVVLAAAVAVLLGSATPAFALSGDIRVHDPSVIKSGSCYYAFSTGVGGGPGNGSITIRKSCGNNGSSGWTFVKPVFNSVPGWITQRLGQTPPNLWAPDINYVNGEFRLYYAAAIWGSSSGTAATGLATASSIEGTWTDRGQVTDQNSPIDPDLAYSGSTPHLVYGGFSGAYVRPLGSDGKPTSAGSTRITYRIEGSSIIYNGGYYYLLGSKGRCCAGTSSTYYTVVGRSRNLTGPYLDKSNVNLLDGGGTRILSGSGSQVGAGGGDVFFDGSTPKFAYHYYDADNGGQESLNIRTISFSGGWPTFGAPL